MISVKDKVVVNLRKKKKLSQGWNKIRKFKFWKYRRNFWEVSFKFLKIIIFYLYDLLYNEKNEYIYKNKHGNNEIDEIFSVMNHFDGFYILHLHIVTSFTLLTKFDEYDDAIISDEKCIYKSYTLSQLTRWLIFHLEFTTNNLSETLSISYNIMILTIKEKGKAR